MAHIRSYQDSTTTQRNTPKHSTNIYSESLNDDRHSHGTSSIQEKEADEAGVTERTTKLSRTLKPRHMQMIAFGGTIGTGLFIGSGTALQNGGPLGCLLGYFLVALVVSCVILSLAEMTTLFPVSGSFTHYAARFVDPALGFTQGFNYWYLWGIAVPLSLTASSIVISYWDSKTSPAVYITCFFILVVLINLLGTAMYGETEFWLSAVKVLAIIGLMILGIVLMLGGGPTHDRIGFRYWRDNGVFAQYNGIPGALGQFLAFWSTFINGAFSYSGSELVAVTAGEAKNPRRNIPKALKKVIFRLLVLYCGSIFIIGVLVPYDSPDLISASESASNAAASPFVVFINNAQIKALPDIINAVILMAVLSAATSDLYAASRTLYALSIQKPSMTPRLLSYVPRTGLFRNLPVVCVLLTACLGFLAYLNLSSGATVVFNWLVNVSTAAVLLCWFGISLTYLRFYYACKVQGLDRNLLPYKSPLQPYLGWIGTIATLIILIFNGFYVFLAGNWNISSFLTAYIGIPIYIVLYFGYKWWRKTSIIALKDIDLDTGRTDLDIQLEERDARQDTWWRRAYDAVM